MPKETDSQKSVIVIEPRELTPLEKQVVEVSNQVYIVLKANLDTASSLGGFMFYYYGARLFQLGNDIEWMWRQGEPTAKEVVEFFLPEQLKSDAERDSVVVKELVPLVASLEDDSSGVKIVLKRIRGPHNIYKYGVLAQFPKGVQAENPLLGYTTLEQTNSNPDIIFFRPNTACVLHACDDLFKIHRKQGFYIPYRNRQEALNRLQYNTQLQHEYQLEKKAENVVKQEAENYILIGLQSAFSNEPHVIPVSRYWAKPIIDR